MSRIKVCHFSSVHSQTDTRVFYRECRSLAKVYDVTFIGIGNYTGMKDGVFMIGIPKPGNYLIRFIHTIFKVFGEAIKTDASIYHIHDAEMILFGIVLSLSGKKVIYDIHENTYQDILLKPWLPAKLRSVFAFCYRIVLQLGSYFMHYIVVIADPEFLKDFYVKENQYSIIQNYADTGALKKYRVSNRSGLPGNNLFYIGMIRDMYYDIDKLFDALYILKQKGIETHLHCIGYFGAMTGKDFKKHKHWNVIKALVIFHGFLEMEEAYEISKTCKVGICLKNQPESMLVSHERKLFEYMAIGLPSVFCNTHIYQSLNQKCEVGLCVDLKKPEEIAQAIEQILFSNELQETFSNNNIFWSELEYNWEAEALKLLQLYHRLIIPV
ncbi:MAG: glycosyltransferase [Bacteroidota bacterium]|nr:glycosyltransferase [Bacteroidota bacterium]